MVRSRLAAILLAWCVMPCFGQSGLDVGDPAPRLSVDTWVNGSSVARFERGHVYVVEFWATWCSPCIRGIPHLTELQNKYPDDVTIIGVSTRDGRGNDLNAVRRLVAAQGERMDYTVAFCSTPTTWSDWMTAAGRRGIPSAFLVGAEGRIAWIGHPSNLDEPLAAAVASAGGGAGRNTPDEMTDEPESREAIAIKRRIAEALDAGDRGAAIGWMSRLVRIDDIRYSGWAVKRMTLMLEHNERAAMSQLRQQLRRTYKDRPGESAWLVAAVLRSDRSSDHMLELAKPECERLLSAGSSDPRVRLMSAEMAIRAGETDRALLVLEDAMGDAESAKLHQENRAQLIGEIAERIEALRETEPETVESSGG